MHLALPRFVRARAGIIRLVCFFACMCHMFWDGVMAWSVILRDMVLCYSVACHSVLYSVSSLLIVLGVPIRSVVCP